MAVPTVSITGHVLAPDGSAPTSGHITAKLSAPGSTLDGAESVRVAAEVTEDLGTGGTLSFGLVPNDAITPSGTYYLVTYIVGLANGRRVQWAEKWQLTSDDLALDIGAVPRLDAIPGLSIAATFATAAIQADVAAAAAAAADAQAAAELARDEAQAAGAIYPDTATGLAATASGGYFYVPSGSADESLILYQDSAGTAVEVKRYATLSGLFPAVAGKNKFDPSLSTDGKLRDFAAGTLTTYAPGMDFGKHPVQAGRTYTLSMPVSEVGFTGVLYCWNAGGTYLGIANAVGANPKIANGPTGIQWRDPSTTLSGYNCTCTFTIPAAGSSVAYVGVMAGYSTHTTADFNRVVASIQLEEGYGATELVAYSASTLPKEDLSRQADDVLDAGTVKVVKAAGVLYVRTRWSSTEDLVQKLTLATGTTYSNDVINFDGAKVIDRTAAYSATASAYASSTTTLATQGDDACPAAYNATYIGANHGPNFVMEVTANAHGKANADVGSAWVDGSARKFYLMRVVDSNTLWFLSENIGTATGWDFDVTFSGATLTHSSGATNTGAITIGASGVTQLYPITQNRTKAIRLDGLVNVHRDGVYTCRSLQVVESYDIPNVASALDLVKGTTGQTGDRVYTDPSITSQSRLTMAYVFAPNGSCTVYSTFQAKQALTIGYVGFIQASALSFSGKSLLQYIPKVLPWVGGIKTWDWAATEDISGTLELYRAQAAQWADANNPPDRMAQLVKNGSVKEFGFLCGFSPLRGVGVPATRKTHVDDALILFDTRKMYPKGIEQGGSQFGGVGTVTAGSRYDAVAYRCFYNLKPHQDTTVFTWFMDGSDVVVVFDCHQAVTAKVLPLPPQFTGKTVTVVEKHANLTLLGGSYVSTDGLIVTVTGTYGYAVLRLS